MEPRSALVWWRFSAHSDGLESLAIDADGAGGTVVTEDRGRTETDQETSGLFIGALWPARESWPFLCYHQSPSWIGLVVSYFFYHKTRGIYYQVRKTYIYAYVYEHNRKGYR